MEEFSARFLRSLFARWIQRAPVTRSPRYSCRLACEGGRRSKQRLLPTLPEQPLRAVPEQSDAVGHRGNPSPAAQAEQERNLGKNTITDLVPPTNDARFLTGYDHSTATTRRRPAGGQVSPIADNLYLSMQEVAHAGEHHGEAEAVGGGYHVRIAY